METFAERFKAILKQALIWGMYGGIIGLIGTVIAILSDRGFSDGFVNFMGECGLGGLVGVCAGMSLYTTVRRIKRLFGL